MPIYEYKCKKCGAKFESYRSMFASDKSVKCPKCGEQKPERQISKFSSKGGCGVSFNSHFG